MTHASTATITLGGGSNNYAPGVPNYGNSNSSPGVPNYGSSNSSPGVPNYGSSNSSIMQPYGYPTTPTTPTTSLTPQQQAQQNRSRRRRRENVPEHMKHANDVPDSTGPAMIPAARPARSGMEMGTMYQGKPGAIQSSTPDAANQTQSLFMNQHQNKPTQPPRHYEVQQPGNVRYGMAQPASQQVVHPQPVVIQAAQSEADRRRAEEARQKLLEMNLSPEVIEQYKKKFKVLDLNKDGVVNLREFAAISRVLGYKFSKEEVLEIFGRRDLDDSGGISFDEFVIAMYERAQKTKQLAPYREKFRLYDWKGRGYITSDEAYPILKKELGFDENKTEMMIDMFDRNKDYRLSLLEFIDFYKKVEELKLQVQNAFRDFDRNGDGFVDSNEAKAVLIPKGFTEQQVDALIFKFDADADGMLNYKEFASFWDVQLI